MGLLDGLKGELKARLSDEPERQGKRFKKYVGKLFDPRKYVVIGRNRSHRQTPDHSAGNVQLPDFVFRDRRTGALFGVGCEYRSGLNPEGMLDWSDPEKIERYRAFARERYAPVFVVVGLGGLEEAPENMFVIPLKDAGSAALSPGALGRYGRDPKEPFFWEKGVLS
jgi:hypothetical protein